MYLGCCRKFSSKHWEVWRITPVEVIAHPWKHPRTHPGATGWLLWRRPKLWLSQQVSPPGLCTLQQPPGEYPWETSWDTSPTVLWGCLYTLVLGSGAHLCCAAVVSVPDQWSPRTTIKYKKLISRNESWCAIDDEILNSCTLIKILSKLELHRR